MAESLSIVSLWPSTRRELFAAAILAAVYVTVARLGLMLDAVGGFATLVWPPTGLAVAVLFRRSLRLWPGVALGAFVVNAWVGASVPVALGIAAGNTLEAGIAAFLLDRVAFDGRLSRVRDVLVFVALAAVACTIISASIGVASLRASGSIDGAAVGRTWLAWWLGDAMGALIVAPWLLTWSAPVAQGPKGGRLETTLLGAALSAVGVAVFGGLLPGEHGARLGYLVFPPMVWAAVRFGQRGVTTAALWISVLAVGGTALQRGPFAMRPLHEGLLQLQWFMAVVIVVCLVLGAAIGERDRAERIALDAARARDAFLSVASHELRTPLASLMLYLSALRTRLERGIDRSVALERIDRSLRQTEKLGRLVSDLMDVSHIESGRFESRAETVDLSELAAEVVDRTRLDAERAKCPVELVAEERVQGSWDRVKLERLLTSLLSNAFRHAGGSAVELRIASQNGRAVITVRDEGPGIAPERLPHVFDRFERGGRRERGGLGLGLYIARAVVEAHGGRIDVASSPGAGATFVVELPLDAADFARDDGVS